MLWPERKQERLYWWGWSAHGQCGAKADRVAVARAPAELTAPGPLRDAAASAFDSVVVDHGGGVWHCGKGVNTKEKPVAPVKIPLSAKALRVAAGRGFAAAALVDGRVACWGANERQQCGVAEPKVALVAQPAFPAVDGVVEVACGAAFVVAVRADGSVYTWGAICDRATAPAAVSGVTAVACAAGDHHALLLDRAGRASSWGVAATGRLGRGGDAAAPGRVRFGGGASIAKIAAGGASSAAVDGRGALWTWGCNGSGQLGLGDRDDRDRPVKTSFDRCMEVALGEDHAVAVDADGAVWAWGAGRAGRLANDAPDGSPTPLRVEVDEVARVAAGGAHSLAWVGAKAPARAPGEQLARAVASRDRVDAAAAATAVASRACDASAQAVRAADAAVDGAYDRAAAADAARRLVAEKRRAAAAARRATEARETTARREAAREAAAGRAAAREAEARRAAVVPAPPTAPVSPPSPPQTPPATPPSPAPRPDWDALRDVARRDGEAASRALRLADDALRRRSSSFSGWTP